MEKSQYEQKGQDRVLQLQRHGGLGRPLWIPPAPCSCLRMMGKGCFGEVEVARLVSSDRLSLLAHPGSTPQLRGVVPVGVIILNSGGRMALLRPAGSCLFSALLASVPRLLSECRHWCRPLWVSVLWGGGHFRRSGPCRGVSGWHPWFCPHQHSRVAVFTKGNSANPEVCSQGPLFIDSTPLRGWSAIRTLWRVYNSVIKFRAGFGFNSK